MWVTVTRVPAGSGPSTHGDGGIVVELVGKAGDARQEAMAEPDRRIGLEHGAAVAQRLAAERRLDGERAAGPPVGRAKVPLQCHRENRT